MVGCTILNHISDVSQIVRFYEATNYFTISTD